MKTSRRTSHYLAVWCVLAGLNLVPAPGWGGEAEFAGGPAKPRSPSTAGGLRLQLMTRFSAPDVLKLEIGSVVPIVGPPSTNMVWVSPCPGSTNTRPASPNKAQEWLIRAPGATAKSLVIEGPRRGRLFLPSAGKERELPAQRVGDRCRWEVRLPEDQLPGLGNAHIQSVAPVVPPDADGCWVELDSKR